MGTYSEFKQLMRDAGYPVDNSDDFAINDLKWIPAFIASQTYNSGVPYDPVMAAAGLAYPSELPPSLSSQLAVGSFPNGVVWNVATVDGKGQFILTGTGNPVNKWVISNGASVQTGISLRYRHDGAPVLAEEDGSFRIARADDENNAWSFALSVATKGEATLADYEVHLILSLDSSGAPTPVLDFLYDASANTWTATGTDPISDSYISAEKTVVQNIETYVFDFIKSKLLPESMRQEAVPHGRYTITLSAVNSTSGDQASVVVPVTVL